MDASPLTSALAIWTMEELRSRGWSQAELARRAEVDPGAITVFLQGKTSPKISTIEKIARGFGYDPSAMLLVGVRLSRLPHDRRDHVLALLEFLSR